MTHVFVSYAHADRARVTALVSSLQDEGIPVWWDIGLRNAAHFSRELEEKIAQASSVLVIWSRESRNSIWVASEAEKAQRLGKFQQARLDPVDPPMPYNCLSYADVRGDSWGQLIETLRVNHQRASGGGNALPSPELEREDSVPSLDVTSLLMLSAGGLGVAGSMAPLPASFEQAHLYAAAVLAGGALALTAQKWVAVARSGDR